jgi:exonuclease SbcC
VAIRRIEVTAFGALSGSALEFGPGLSVVLGDNETGKSTFYRAMHHTLLTPTSLDKRTLERELGAFFPRPSGNAAECALHLEAGGLYAIRRRWGTDAEEEARLPDGSVVRGAEEVSSLIRRLLPVSPGTLRTVFLADQSELDRTLARLGEAPEARDEAATVLRSIRLEAGGVSPDAFTRLLDARLASLLGRWELERDRPQDGRGHRNPWTRGAGDIVKAFYALEAARERLTAVRNAEQALDEAQAALDEAAARAHGLTDFCTKHEAAYRSISAARGRMSEIRANEETLARLREANRQWPVALRDHEQLTTALADLKTRRAALEERLERSRRLERQKAARERLGRVDALRARLQAAEQELEETPVVDAGAIEELREIEEQLPYAEARLATGTVRVNVESTVEKPLGARVDGEDEEPGTVGPSSPREVSASRQVVLHLDPFTVTVEAGEESFDELREALAVLRGRREKLCAKVGASSAVEGQALLNARKKLGSQVGELENAVANELGVSPEEAETAYAELAAAAGAGEDALETPTDELVEELARVREEAAGTGSRCDAAAALLADLAERYGDQDQLEIELGETSRTLRELRDQAEGGAEVPLGFTDADAFLAEYERARQLRSDAEHELSEQRVAYAELIGSQPDETSEELARSVGDAEARFARLKRDARSLVVIRDRARAIVEEQDESVFDPFVARVEEYVNAATGAAYTTVVSADPLTPERFKRGEGPELPYNLLSQGTRDSLALALRLSLAETLLQGGSAPLVMDDPLVDMDPERRAAAAAMITRYAERHQVIIFTCHPEHAALFPAATITPLPGSTSG